MSVRSVDFGDDEINALWDEAVAGHIEGIAATVLIRFWMPKMATERERLRAVIKRHYETDEEFVDAITEAMRP